MIETQQTVNFTTMPLVSGILLLIFGTFIFIFTIRRRNNRRKLIGINEFTCSDRMVNTKGTEKILRFLAVVLLLSGFILITFEALRIEGKVTNEIAAGGKVIESDSRF
ncbi:hypothetical protein [Pedobacter sp. Leaf176]|uniref:hypothetical protein n=1 Tax=Pedobacter sp. Leaf176 TaxID=1736286 RepID=UPI0006F3EFDE|nr:hypothetical protein [Pedobacter sp. Leaf176]KQR66947.1 hypothetical protein ASF92_19540 [Pedobacter sp. Leaf176]